MGRTKGKELRRRTKEELIPFLGERVNALNSFEIVNEEFPENVQEIFEAIKDKKIRYWLTLRRYRKVYSTVKEHNGSVRLLMKALDELDYRVFYSHPDKVSEEERNGFLEITGLARKFNINDNNPYKEKIEALRSFAVNYQKILEKWNVYMDFVRIRKSISANKEYIGRELRQRYLDQEEIAKEKFSLLRGPLYYPFDALGEVEPLIRRQNDFILAKLAEDPLFDNIGGVSLDQQQRIASVTPEKTALVIAAAGSGKTTTICGRVKYLLERKKVNPEDILLLSYSRKSADDLASKMAKISPLLSVGTFHKIGLDILKETTGNDCVVEEQWDAIIEDYFRVEIGKDEEALRDVLLYYGLYLNDTDRDRRYFSDGALFEDLKKEDYKTLKDCLLELSLDPGNRQTIKKERVKSDEELALANFYFINGIEYEYERPYEIDVHTPEHRQYLPDFYLKDYGIYHEHFGIDQEGRAKQYEGAIEQRYLGDIRWKRVCHSLNHTKLIETTSGEFKEGNVFEKLKTKLNEMGVVFKPLGKEKVQQALESIYEGQSYKSLINLIKSFLSLYKARYEDDSQFEELKKSPFVSGFAKTRASLFLTVCKRVYNYYINRLRGEGKIDFDDMILRSQRSLSQSSSFHFKYIIVDEFQDISFSRMNFLKALLNRDDGSLFAAGDDWQSIYRFSGCDVNIMLEFEKHFGACELYYIGNVHRNSQQLQDIAKRFVEKNPEQIKKNIHSSKSLENPVRVVYYGSYEPDALEEAFASISEMNPQAKVLLLGRNNKDVNRFFSPNFYFSKSKGKYISLNYPKLELSYSTVHGSKGLEEDYVILLSAKDSSNGFPNKTEDDPLLNLVMSSKSPFPYAEERRLWYVALTRTRSLTYILVPAWAPSIFIKEIRGEYFELNPYMREALSRQISCPRCKEGHLVAREKDGETFYGCSNYPYCTYSINDKEAVARNQRCPLCGDFVVMKVSQYGPYYACRNFPKRCRFKVKSHS